MGIKLKVTFLCVGCGSAVFLAGDNLIKEPTLLLDLKRFLFAVDLQVFSLPPLSLVLKKSTIHREKGIP